jgi:hypothetical protein
MEMCTTGGRRIYQRRQVGPPSVDGEHQRWRGGSAPRCQSAIHEARGELRRQAGHQHQAVSLSDQVTDYGLALAILDVLQWRKLNRPSFDQAFDGALDGAIPRLDQSGDSSNFGRLNFLTLREPTPNVMAPISVRTSLRTCVPNCAPIRPPDAGNPRRNKMVAAHFRSLISGCLSFKEGARSKGYYSI